MLLEKWSNKIKKDETWRLQVWVAEDSVLLKHELATFPEKNVLLKLANKLHTILTRKAWIDATVLIWRENSSYEKLPAKET